MKKRLFVIALATMAALSGCSEARMRQLDETALPALEYTRPEGEIAGVQAQKSLKSQGKLSDGSDYILYASNELEINTDILQTSLKTEKVLADVLKDITMLTLNVESIGPGACSDLTVIQQVNLGENVRIIEENAFAKCTTLNRVQFPEGLEEIGDYAFHGCSSLWSADIPSGVTRMGRQIFVDCDALRSIVIDSDVGEASFAECKALREVIFGENCQKIGKEAFSDCTGIKNLRIGDSVSRIEDQAFSGCENIAYVYFPASIKYIGHLAFANVQRVNTFECQNLVEYYKIKREEDFAKDSQLAWMAPKEVKE